MFVASRARDALFASVQAFAKCGADASVEGFRIETNPLRSAVCRERRRGGFFYGREASSLPQRRVRFFSFFTAFFFESMLVRPVRLSKSNANDANDDLVTTLADPRTRRIREVWCRYDTQESIDQALTDRFLKVGVDPTLHGAFVRRCISATMHRADRTAGSLTDTLRLLWSAPLRISIRFDGVSPFDVDVDGADERGVDRIGTIGLAERLIVPVRSLTVDAMVLVAKSMRCCEKSPNSHRCESATDRRALVSHFVLQLMRTARVSAKSFDGGAFLTCLRSAWYRSREAMRRSDSSARSRGWYCRVASALSRRRFSVEGACRDLSSLLTCANSGNGRCCSVCHQLCARRFERAGPLSSECKS